MHRCLLPVNKVNHSTLQVLALRWRLSRRSACSAKSRWLLARWSSRPVFIGDQWKFEKGWLQILFLISLLVWFLTLKKAGPWSFWRSSWRFQCFEKLSKSKRFLRQEGIDSLCRLGWSKPAALSTWKVQIVQKVVEAGIDWCYFCFAYGAVTLPKVDSVHARLVDVTPGSAGCAAASGANCRAGGAGRQWRVGAFCADVFRV